MNLEGAYRTGLQLALTLVLVFPVHDLLNEFEITTHIPVEGFIRGLVIALFCVFPPMLFFHFYEIRRRRRA